VTAGKIDLGTAGADVTVVADIDRIVRIVRISVADISKTWRPSRRRMTTAPATSRGNPNNQQRQTLLAHSPAG
jgi:phage baseplate assembly protein gpV